MGRKKVGISHYLSKYDIFKNIDGNLVCKTCNTEVTLAENRIQEHINSKLHKKIVEKVQNQPKITQQFAKKSKFENEDDVAIDLIKVFIHDNIPFNKWTQKNSELQKFLFKYAPVTRTIPTSSHYFKKYVPLVFKDSISILKNSLTLCSAFNLIIDESPSKHGEPYFNILITFIANNKVETKMLCSKLMSNTNAASFALVIGEVLNEYEIGKTKIYSITCDSAAYNKKLVNDLKIAIPNVKRIPCFTHIINIAIKESIKCYYKNVFEFCMRFASKLKINRKFSNLFRNEFETFNIPRVCEIRWYSFYESLSRIYLNFGLIKSVFQMNGNNQKIADLLKILKVETSNDWEILHYKIYLLLNFLEQVMKISKYSEKEICYMFDIEKYLRKEGFKICEKHTESTILSPKLKFECLNFYGDFKKYFFECFQVFFLYIFCLKNKKKISNNYPAEFINENGIFSTSTAFTNNSAITDFENILQWISVDKISFVQELGQYRKLEYKYDNFLEHWIQIKHLYPSLFRIVEVIVVSKISSADVERSFSKFRIIDTDNRQSMGTELKNMLNILYFNK